MKKLYLTILAMLLVVSGQAFAAQSIGLKFNRTGTNASTVAISVVDESGAAISGASAAMTSTHEFKGTGSSITNAILCPNVNGNSNPTIDLVFTISGVPAGFTFNAIGLDIHALNSGGGYQANNDNKVRQWNIAATVNNTTFGTLDNIDIAAGVNGQNGVHKMWNVTGATVNSNGSLTIKLTISKGATNEGCFFGLGEVRLSTDGETPAPEPEPEPEPAPDGDYKVYYIQWKNTGTNYITEDADHRMSVQSQNNTKAQFWMFIPTDKENCYHIKNTATGRYMGSCNLTPASASKITTSPSPVEYYVGKSNVKTGLHYFSSTDCANYNNESAGPRALNKDGASEYVITWVTQQNGTYDDGSYWKLVETPDLYEVRAFEPSTAIGNIGASYNVESTSGKHLTIVDGNLTLATPDTFDESQEWYFVGTSNSTGYKIASAAEPDIVVGIADGKPVTGAGLATTWKVNADKTQKGYFSFASNGTTLTVDGESLFRFTRLRSTFQRKLKIYNNPCGSTGSNYITRATLHGEGVLNNIVYEASSKPGSWHVVYAADKGTVTKGQELTLDATLSGSAATDLNITAHFDWNSDGVFETAVPLNISGTTATANATVPEWAAETQTRMRLRVNSNGLDLAEDEVYGFIYDWHINVTQAQEKRTATVSVNSWERGKAELSSSAGSHAYGTTLTATATAYGTAQFVCWREEGVVVSTDAEYTFTVDHNVNLKAYFTPNTNEASYPTNIEELEEATDVTITQQGETLVVTGNCDVKAIMLYTIDAAKIASTNGATISTAGIKEGLYIACVITDKGYKNVKIYLNK